MIWAWIRKFRAIIRYQGSLAESDLDWKSSQNNVQVEWETAKITFEPFSVISADEPVTCAAYAKEHDWKAGIGSGDLPRKIKFLQEQSSKVRSDKSGSSKPTCLGT